MPPLRNSQRTSLRASLARGLRRLRRQYRGSLRPEAAAAGAVYQEWLRDNYYLLEREGGALLRELRKCPAAPLARMAALCRELCPGGRIPEEEALCGGLLAARCSSQEVSLLHPALRLTLLRAAADSARADSPEEKISLVSGAVTSLRTLPDIDFAALTERASPLERCLRRDPAGVFPHMEESSRWVYRHLLQRLAKRQRRSAEEYASSLVETAAGAQEGDPARHIGVPLLEQSRHIARGQALLITETLLPPLIALALAFLLRAWYLFPMLTLPLCALCRVFLEALFLRGIEPIPLSRLELGGKVPEEGRTLVTVATLLPGAKGAPELARHMEALYNANGGPCVDVCALADLKGADRAELPQDEEDIAAMRREVERLGEKYGGGFLLAVRPRAYSKTMGSYAGRERKRGAICDLAQAIVGCAAHSAPGGCGQPPLQGNISIYGDTSHLHGYKFLLALDSDTELPLDTVPDMVAAALHPANRPRFDPAMGRVVGGYGILAPHVELDLASARKTPFAHAMAGEGGNSPYSNHVSERYQDLFGCGIFAGKGLIDIEAFARVSRARPFPEEQVLSHDILEGGYLRAGFLADVHVSDGFPARQHSYFTRQERWVRGDWQNIPFLSKKRGLPPLSRYQLFDNLRRSLIAPACLLAVLVSLFAPRPIALILLLGGVLGVCGGHLFSALRCLGSGLSMLSRDFYSGGLPAALGDLIRCALQALTLAQSGWMNTCAAVRGLWRGLLTKKRRLEWTTAAQSDAAKNGPRSLLFLWPSLAAGAALLIFGGAGQRLVGLALLANLLFAPLSGRSYKNDGTKLTQPERETLEGYCKAMWNYFETYCVPEQNWLPPDNVQEAPVFRVAPRTSPTNIGLYLLCVLAARDLGLINGKEMAERLSRTLSAVEKLELWHGSPLNWYDTRTLRPLEPRYVSTVDTGNFLVSVRTLRKGLEEYLEEEPALVSIIGRLRALEEGCDLRPLYHARRKLFHIGIDLSRAKISPSYYDLLMSEARLASYYAIAARMIPKKHWGALGRTLVRQGRFTGPVSWTGTMFEYFMPYLFLPAPKGTLGYEALRFCLSCQRRRLRQMPQLPWGVSESGFYAFDPDLNYQYKAHGVQKLGLRRSLDEELVLAPYASFLAMQVAPKSALQNLKRFERMEMLGGCGFYEAADATPIRVGGQDYAVVRSYMAHHVSMSLLSALNTLREGALRRRFMADEEMARAKSLLDERIPDRAAVFRDVGLRDTPRPRERVSSAKQAFACADPANPKTLLLSNGEWSGVFTDCGAGVSFYRGVSIFRHSPDLLRRSPGILVTLLEQGRAPVSVTPAPHYNAAKCKIEFSASEALYYGEGERAGVTVRARVHPRLPAEERRVTVKNIARRSAEGVVSLRFEPSLAPPREEAEHPAFSKLFLVEEYDADSGAVTFFRRKRDSCETLCLAMGACGAAAAFGPVSDNSGAAQFEIPYRLGPGESREFSLFFCAGVSREEAVRRLESLRAAPQTPRRSLNPFKEGEMPAALAQRILPKLLFYAPLSARQAKAREKCRVPRSALWPLGLSGETPYVYLPVRGEDDIPSVLPYFSLLRRLRAAGVPCEMAVGYHEGGDYHTPVCAALREALRREHCVHLENHGLRLINLHRADHAAEEALEAYAAHIGIREQESGSREDASAPLLAIRGQNTGSRQGTFGEEKFIIEKTAFSDSCTLTPDSSPPWSLALCNPAFGALVSDSALGFTWAVNARENKLTPWYNDPCAPNRGELLLLKFGNQVHDLLLGARCEFAPDRARWFGEIHGLRYEVTAAVPARGLTKRVELKMTNGTGRTLTPELCYYMEPVLGVRREPHLPILGEALPDGLLLHSPAGAVQGFTALLLPGGADFTCISRAQFLRGHWHGGGFLPSEDDPCAAVGRRLQIPPGGEVCMSFALNWGAQRNAALCAHMVADAGSKAQVNIRIQTPDEALNHMVNTWLPHQIAACRLFGRTGHAQCGGAWGFRDQLQDVSAFLMTRPALAKIQIARCAAAQFSEGDVLHWWHRLPGQGVRGVRTRCSDDYLWLPFVAAEYVLMTGDRAFLDAQIPFREGAPLEPEETERYAAYYLGGGRAGLYDHCLRAVDRALGLMGAHGMPLMLGGDWNDGMQSVGARGAGESVWLAMFLIMVLERTAKLCEMKNDPGRAANYIAEANRLRGEAEKNCWAGDRYLRAFWDDGQPLGGGGDGPCNIDLLPQAFASLCGLPDKERIRQALSTAQEKLVQPEYNLLRLLREPFTHQGRRAGYINDYPPGVRENGGQYTHAAVWLIMALFKEGRADEAYELLRMINPADFCGDSARAVNYQGEPYALAGDVSAAPGREGRAGWTLYTGSAAWFWRCAVESMLGITMEGGEIRVRPNLPKGWAGKVKVWWGEREILL